VVEFAAVRMLAPAFGQSSAVWAADVGVVLLALAVGYAGGGRLADRSPGGRVHALALAAGGVWLAAVALVGPGLARSLVPSGAAEAGTHSSALGGSLLACALLFAAPTAALGAAAPLLVRRASASGREGRAAGYVSAAGTAGALLGCYLTPLRLLPEWGTRATTLFAAALSFAAAALVATRRGAPSAAAGTAAGGATAPPPAAVPPGARALHAGHLAVAFLAGFVVIAAEFAGVRILGPYFGQSNAIWANAVGVVLLGLALGAAVGGRLADRARTTRPLYVALALAALWIAGAGRFATATASWLVPPDLAPDQALPMAFYGSLAADALWFGPPAALLGLASPVLVRRETRPGCEGRAAGLVFAAGTLGSLLGAIATPSGLVPRVGSRGVCFLCAVALATACVVALARRGGARGLAAAVVALAGTLALWATASGPLRHDVGQVEEIESAYQTVRVVERETLAPLPGRSPFSWGASAFPTRFLRFDEDVDSYQSVYLPGASARMLSAGRYYDHLALGAWFEGMPWARAAPSKPSVLIVGYAGGTLHRVLRDVAPAGLEPRVLGVEIDPAVVDVARARFDLAAVLDEDTTLVLGEDGRTVVNGLPSGRRFDLILVDAYLRTQYVPFQVATVEFFRACLAHLEPTGAIGLNVLANGVQGRVPRAIAATMAEAAGPGGSVSLVPNVQYRGSVAIWARPGPPPRVAPGVRPVLATAAAALERLLVRHVPATDGGEVLTDDRAPTEDLTDRMLLGGEEATR
jgi:hypothetical protein